MSARDSRLADWTAALAEPHGDPGGGAASAVMLSMAAALTSMTAGYAAAERFGDAPDDAEWEERRGVIERRARKLRARALELADADAAVSGAFAPAYSIDDRREREEAVAQVSAAATRTSQLIGEAALALPDDLEWLARHGNPALLADVAVARSALRGALCGARTNLTADGGDELTADERASLARFDEAIARLDARTPTS
ncbi:cyclodeaminase/cyclohydrolase family protein [Herbiconiux sp. KACC 21604]|uniref:cyclodeaminase/cyclohydrolase family protein n=1 Tax=unclassified Herbiconiux TaxID=2618217 RepID=UPI0014918155|nr:cyclodeaminase/cyclohydrolase family protein [Herbiconiux sp. SALV-R1]QJU54889.1 cyclodeaminase/cyclohydrolase family protein [Herbiconiux sp. SALV-R1]WPO86012.1 cyclodeaminase/cyclohydrolase family protein [Herbiconiux sp. KACC 21604]